LKREAPVGPDDTAGTLYYKTLFPLGVQTVLDSVDLIAAGRAPREGQAEALASYAPLLGDGHAAIDWSASQQAVHDLIRGCDPQPGAHTVHRGTRLRLFEPHRVDGTGAAGSVLAGGGAGIVVATAGGAAGLRPAPR